MKKLQLPDWKKYCDFLENTIPFGTGWDGYYKVLEVDSKNLMNKTIINHAQKPYKITPDIIEMLPARVIVFVYTKNRKTFEFTDEDAIILAMWVTFKNKEQAEDFFEKLWEDYDVYARAVAKDLDGVGFVIKFGDDE